MKMMIWNCGGAFANQQKYRRIPPDIDIGVIIECNNIGPQSMKEKVKYAWRLELKKRQVFANYHYDIHKETDLGIAAFVYNDKYKLKKEYIIADWLKHFLVFTINDKIRIVVYHGYSKGLNGIGDLRYAIDRYKKNYLTIYHYLFVEILIVIPIKIVKIQFILTANVKKKW